jgi:hypothetical protein
MRSVIYTICYIFFLSPRFMHNFFYNIKFSEFVHTIIFSLVSIIYLSPNSNTSITLKNLKLFFSFVDIVNGDCKTEFNFKMISMDPKS